MESAGTRAYVGVWGIALLQVESRAMTVVRIGILHSNLSPYLRRFKVVCEIARRYLLAVWKVAIFDAGN